MYVTSTPAILASALHKVFADSAQAPDSIALWLDIAAEAAREFSMPVMPSVLPWVPVFLNYRLYRTEGEFFPLTGSVRITTGPLVGNTFADPDSAARAVVVATPAPVADMMRKVSPSWRFRSTGTPAAFTPRAGHI
ncbi:hypothetical protein [Nocardia asteroides]|uniref:hypothetical protein n=1 Tax=Nocardia asteroides TaxID=1824 RepID=UPI001E53A2B6|nr:hypothetical protein [Nocardia asteroides]UGT59888.1 hypothetical protein LTT61_22035 [Nocardia asteroides]